MRVPDRTLRLSGRWLGVAMSAALLGSLIPHGGVAAASATQLVINPAAPASAVSGIVLSLTVKAEDGSNTVDGGFVGTVHVASSDPSAVLPADYLYTSGDAGSHTFAVTLKTFGSQTVTFSSGSLTDAVATVTVTASKLVFSSTPSSPQTAGTPFNVTVLAEDSLGNVATNFTGSVTLTSSDAQFSVTPASPYTYVGGDAGSKLFAVTLRTAGSQNFTFSSAGLASASATVTVNAAAANKLAFTQSPSTSAATVAFTTQPVVAVQDQYGNTITTDNSTVVTLAITAGTPTSGGSGAQLTCTTSLSRTVIAGTASFGGCAINVMGNGYKLHATSNPSYAAADSSLFNVSSGPPSKLAFYWNTVGTTTVPSGSTGGAAFPVQPVIVLQDASGNTVTSNSTANVALSITSNTTGATLTCNGGLSKVFSLGVATFSGCSIDKVGTYQLTASSYPYYTPMTSGSFVVSAGPPVKLTFTAQPTSGTAAQAFPIQPVVAITDAGGNVATTSSATITLSLTSYTSGGVLTCTSGLSRTTVSGVATFSGCSINAAGTNYVITATATNVYPVTSLSAVSGNAFTVTAPAAQISLSTSASVITWSKPVTLTVQFGTNGGNKSFALQTSPDMVNWTTIPTAPTTTNSAGTATFTWTPARNFWYRVQFLGAPDLSAANSNVVRVVVRQIALLRPTNSGRTKTIASGAEVTFTTTVRPARPELPKAKVTFTFTLYRAGHIAYSGRREVYIDSAGLAKWTWKFGSSGLWYVRAIANPTMANANSVWSPIEKYFVP